MACLYSLVGQIPQGHRGGRASVPLEGAYATLA